MHLVRLFYSIIYCGDFISKRCIHFLYNILLEVNKVETWGSISWVVITVRQWVTRSLYIMPELQNQGGLMLMLTVTKAVKKLVSPPTTLHLPV